MDVMDTGGGDDLELSWSLDLGLDLDLDLDLPDLPDFGIPDIPKFEETDGPENKHNMSTEGASTSAAAMDDHPAGVVSNGTDTLDVGDHDMDGYSSAEHTRTDDEFENDERLMEEEYEVKKPMKEVVEIEDLFDEEDRDGGAPPIIMNGEKEKLEKEYEDIFKDDAAKQDYEPIFKTQEQEECEPVVKIIYTEAEPERDSEPEIDLDNLNNGEAESPAQGEVEVDLPFPDMPRKSDISLNWEAEEMEAGSSPATSAPLEDTPIIVSPKAAVDNECEEEIDEGEVAKFVEKIILNSMQEVSSLASDEQEDESQMERVAGVPVDLEVSEPAFGAPETTVESENVSASEASFSSANVDVVSEPAQNEDLSFSTEYSATAHADFSGLAKGDSEGVCVAVPVVVEKEKTEMPEPVRETPETETIDIMDKKEEIVSATQNAESSETKAEVTTNNSDFSETRTRKMSVPRPRDVRKDLSETRPSFFGSGSSGQKSFLSNTLPRVSVLPRISTTFQRKSPTSPLSLSGDYSSFDKESEELPTVAKPDLTRDDSQVMNELETIELPHIEALSAPPKSMVSPVAAPTQKDASIVPIKDSPVQTGLISPVYAHSAATTAPVVLDGTSPEEIEAMFAKDTEPEPPKKTSMGKNDVIASTRVRKISRTTWKGQEEFQKSVDKAKVVLDEPQAASLKRYEERKKQRFDGFPGKGRLRGDSTSEAESDGGQSSPTTPKMPDVVQSGGAVPTSPQSEIVAPKLNMKSVRSLWEQKAAEVEQRRKSLQTKRRPVSQGERTRIPNYKNINKSCDNIDSLDDSLEGNTTFSYDGASDDSSSKRESLIEREVRLQRERNLEIAKERERLRSESTSSRDESQQSETSETQDDQVVDIVRDTEIRRDSDDGRSSPSQSSGYTSGRSTPSTPADDILKGKSGKSSGKTPELKLSLSPTDPDSSTNYKEYQKALRGNKADGKFSKSATFPRRMENFDKQPAGYSPVIANRPEWRPLKLKSIFLTKHEVDSSNISPTNSVGDVPDVIMVDGHKSISTSSSSSSSSSGDKPRKTSIVQQGIQLSNTLEKKKKVKNEPLPRRSLMEIEIAAQREKEEAFRREQQTRKMSTSSKSDESPSSSNSQASSPAVTPQTSPRKSSISGPSAKSVYKDLNYKPQNKKKLAMADHWEHKWK